jgi:hypothetical protein
LEAELPHILLEDTVKLLCGAGLTVTKTVVGKEAQPGGVVLAAESVIVFTETPPLSAQETIWGPTPTGLPPTQPSQFQVYTPPGKGEVTVRVVVLLAVELLEHMETGLAVKLEVGRATTFTVVVKVLEQLAGAGLFIVRVIVLTPTVFHE